MFHDLEDTKQKLASVKVENGSVVFALYPGEREVQPGYRKSKFEERQFGLQSLVFSRVLME